MHDLDRVLFEMGERELAGESPQNEFLEVLGEVSGESAHEMHEMHEAHEQSGGSLQETAQAQETYELELASELLGVGNEAELEEFLGNLISGATSAARGFAASPTGRQLGSILKQAAKQALPVVGGALGDWVAPGGAGAKWGTRVGSGAGDLFGLELEGMSSEDRELEVARGFVRFANAAARTAARSRGASPGGVARRAVAVAARQHAPGIYARLQGWDDAGASADPGTARPATGTWARRGSVVILYGL